MNIVARIFYKMGYVRRSTRISDDGKAKLIVRTDPNRPISPSNPEFIMNLSQEVAFDLVFNEIRPHIGPKTAPIDELDITKK